METEEAPARAVALTACPALTEAYASPDPVTAGIEPDGPAPGRNVLRSNRICGARSTQGGIVLQEELRLDPKRFALVVIDLQKGIVSIPGQPHGTAQVVANAARLADACRSRGAYVVLVHVGPSPDGKDALHPITDPIPARPPPAPGWDQIVPELGPKPGDHVVRKRQWGAFYGTDLDLQLRRRGIDTILLCGISTNFGVESTARDAYERGYHQIFVEDACTSRAADDHAFPFRIIFPRIGLVRSTEDVLRALQPSVPV